MTAERFIRAEAVLEMQMRANREDPVDQAPLDGAPGVAEQEVRLQRRQDAPEADHVAQAEKATLGDGYGEHPDIQRGVEPVEAVDIAIHRDDRMAVGRSKAIRDLGETHLLTADLEGREDMK